MNARRVFLSAVFACLCGASAQATLITADFVRAEVPPNSTTVPLPFLLNGTDDAVFLKFKIPNIDQIVAVNSFEIDLTVYDNGDRRQGETGEFQFAQPGPNVFLAAFGPDLNGTTASSPVTFAIPLCSCQISQVFPTILDGTFRVRVQRDSGDFFLAGGSAFLDVTLAPEPSALFGTAAGLLLIAGLVQRRARRK